MEPVYIPNLIHMSGRQQRYDIQEHLEGLDTLTPVNGKVSVAHHGNFLEVIAKAETIVTLSCDRCLQQYNHRLEVDVSELIWLEEAADLDEDESDAEVEVAMDDLVETLSPKGHFHPGEWLYEQLCLAIPQRQLCDSACPGIAIEDEASEPALQPIDQRWASLQAFKENLLN